MNQIQIGMGRKQRRDKGSVLLTKRDEVVLEWIGEQYGVRLDQLRRLLAKHTEHVTKMDGMVAVTTAASVVDRWLRAGLVQAQKYRVKEPSWIWLTRAGLAHVSLDYHYKPMNIVMLEHIYWVNQVRLTTAKRWTENGLTRMWVSERRIRRAMPKPDSKKERHRHIPDAVVETERGTVAVEVELTAKKPHDLEMLMWSMANEYAGVWYFCNARTQRGVEHIVAKLSATMKGKLRVLDLEDLK